MRAGPARRPRASAGPRSLFSSGLHWRTPLQTGFTLPEALVAVLVGLLVLAGVHRLFVAGLTTQTVTSIETEINRKAQVAMDDIVRRLRGGRGVTDARADRIAFVDQEGQTVRYWVDGGRLYRALGGTGYTGGVLMARDVSQLALGYHDAAGAPVAEPARAVRVAVQIEVSRASHAARLRSAVGLRNVPR